MIWTTFANSFSQNLSRGFALILHCVVLEAYLWQLVVVCWCGTKACTESGSVLLVMLEIAVGKEESAWMSVCLSVCLSGFQSEHWSVRRVWVCWKPPLGSDCLSSCCARQKCWNTSLPETQQTSGRTAWFLCTLWCVCSLCFSAGSSRNGLGGGGWGAMTTQYFVILSYYTGKTCTYVLVIKSLPLRQKQTSADFFINIVSRDSL